MGKNLFLLIFFNIALVCQAQTPVLKATRINTAPVIDGYLNDEVWKNIAPAKDFKQSDPVSNGPAYQRSEVKIAYDDRAVYVAAMLYDMRPDSILKQLGLRDDDNLNSEYFSIAFDTYNTKQDAYHFGVYASGVQQDFKDQDPTYDAVWESKTLITEEGWCVEMKIPYAALRFPDKPIQDWGLYIGRQIRRVRHRDEWAVVPPTAGQPLNHWGKLEGIANIKPPVRLSLIPYISTSLQNYPYNTPGIKNTLLTYDAGADIKYGIDERFTLDMILLPDFSQVASDNYVKNISPFEVAYGENRQFFKEGTELFQRGNLFYSRRIGRMPTGHDNLVNEVDTAKEKIANNPTQTRLLNATKISGRTANGLGIGIFNAVTDNTYATIENKADGSTRKVLTEPLTNYNIVVFDQQLKHNSSAYFINTNTSRTNTNYNSANVSGTGLRLDDASNTYEWGTDAALSKLYNNINPFSNGGKPGYRYSSYIAKITGNFLFTVGRYVTDNTFNIDGLGYLQYNDFIRHQLVLIYNIYKPFGPFLKTYNTLVVNYNNNYTSGLNTSITTNFNNYSILQNYFSFYYGFNIQPVSGRDYYEPRTVGRYYQNPSYGVVYAGISSDYRKPFALDISLTMLYNNFEGGERYYKVEVSPLIRPSDKFTFRHDVSVEKDLNSVGFAANDTNGDIIFGVRNINTVANTFTGKYLFTPNMNISLKLRHYWSSGFYKSYKTLLSGANEGELGENTTYTGNADFNTNFFNIDLIYDWRFAPGSNITVVYKNAIQSSESTVLNNYYSNVDNILAQPMSNSISVKVLYYLDYQYLIKRKNNNDRG